MLWGVTGAAPRTGEAIQERFTIHTFSTGFPQPELPGLGEGLWNSACKVEKDGSMRQSLAASRRALGLLPLLLSGEGRLPMRGDRGLQQYPIRNLIVFATLSELTRAVC